MSIPQQKQSAATFIDAASIGQPAVRMVVVEAWAVVDSDSGEPFDGYVVHPVVGLSIVASREFVRSGYHAAPATPALAARGGWRLVDSEVEYQPLIVDDEYDVQDVATLRRLTSSCFVVVACPWPSDEDDERLAEHVEKAKADARRWRSSDAA